MSIVGHSSGNLNDVRSYPFADSASLIDDAGRRLPEYVLNDCHIWWPDIYGRVGFVSAVTVSPSLITAVFSAYDEDTAVSTAIAALSISLPVTPYRSYAVQAMQGGVGGWAAVGRVPMAAAMETWLFSTPTSARLLDRLAQSYPVYPVRTLGEYENPTALKGHVNLVAAGGLTIEEGLREIDGEQKRCIVFGLDPDQLPGLYELFAGPCGRRPESQTCSKTPIRTINGVEPDCNGLLYIEVDDSTGVLEGKLDVTDDAEGDSGGVALFTPVEVADVCDPVTPFAPRYEDTCGQHSSSSFAVEPVSSSSTASEEELSSSLSVSSVSYPMDDPNELLDWSLFDGLDSDHYVPDWEPAVSGFGGAYRPNMDDGRLILPTADVPDERRLFNNAYRVEMDETNRSARLDLSFLLSYSDLSDLELGSDHDRVAHIYLENMFPLTDSEHRGWRVRLQYRRTSLNAVTLTANVQYSDGSGSWLTIGSSWEEIIPLNTGSSSSSDFGEFVVQTSFMRLEATDVVMGEYDITWGVNTFSETLVFADLTGNYPDAQFFSIGWRASAPDPQTAAVASTRLFIEQIDVAANDLVAQSCNDLDFVSESGLAYALKFDPGAGWSNDFYITRAHAQMTRRPNESLLLYQGLTTQDGAIYAPRQYIDAVGHDHKYAILSCLDGLVGDYVVSVALKYVSGQPKAGLVVGFQTADARDVFWAVMVDLVGQRITYGIHVSPHIFVPAGWEGLSVSGDGWPYEWHRLVVRMTGGPSTFAVSAWVDPDAFTSSSSPLPEAKTIGIDYNNPDYVRTGLAAWNGSVSAFMFADGRVGAYAFGGAAKFAELTVSPDEQDIVVPNKLPWLGR